MDAKYNPKDIEAKWYQYWLDNKFFHSEPDDREPYTVVIPPPNVTGVLHMGHMLNNTIQDILVRRARQEGKNACWVPGTDHASIATEAKVVNKLAQQGIKKTDLTREQFLEHAWDWTREHGGIILQQLRKLGASCDWDRTGFTMDETRSKSVIRVFCDLYNKGLIYRGVRMVNWDPKALTALSDEEVIFKEHHGKLYYLRYKVEGEDGYAVVATTRPETIMGDTAMCINPNNPKTAWLRGKRVIVPLVNRVIPVIEDDYVDMEFGTGCLKVTPAHDVNDYMLGEKYNLPSIDIFNDNGTLSEAAGLYVGMDRFDCREQIEKDLEAAGLLEKTEDYTNNVGFSERTNVPIEPKLSMQWFLRMEHFAQMALPPVMEDRLKFYPAKYKNTYKHWLENIKDWCISRQLWWGHRIPAYYVEDSIIQKFKDSKIPRVIVAETEEEAFMQLQKQCPEIFESLNLESLNVSKSQILTQDPDCLDTWFSSWLWPISLFNGILDPDNKEIQYYYPTADLVTGPDIIFFWVARMIMAGYEYKGDMPFRNVYFTGIVRDKLGRKMSKSLGNSPDPLDLIERFGADGVRMGMMLSAPAGNDILFDESLCEQGRNFNNKIWNCFRLVQGWQVAETEQPEYARLATNWFAQKLQTTADEVADLFGKYRISEALMAVYKLFWDEFSSWYLEVIKPAYGQPIDQTTYTLTLTYFDALLRLLHPFMPFITEELWQNLTPRADGESIMTEPLLTLKVSDNNLLAQVEDLKAVVAGIRNIRAQRNIAPKETLTLQVTGSRSFSEAEKQTLTKLCNLAAIDKVEQKAAGAASFIAGVTEYAVPLDKFVNKDEELQKLQAELAHQEGFLKSVLAKLQNERFVQNAKPEIVERERQKQHDAESRIAALRESIAALQ